jgi:hypothetical protein
LAAAPPAPDLEALRRQAFAARMLRLRKCARELPLFIETCAQDDHGNPIKLAPMHRHWITHVEYCWAHGLKALILAPWGHGKSSTLAVPLIAWKLGCDPGLRVKVVTNDDDSATGRVGAAKNLIESLTYKQIFPHVRKGGTWTDHKIFLERGGNAIDPSLHARGIMTKGIGGRIDLLVFDDIVDQLNSCGSPEQRQKIVNFAEQTWMSRLEPDAQVLAIGTTWHIADAWHHFMTALGWGTLIQRVNADCTAIDQEVVGVGPDYPGMLAA